MKLLVYEHASGGGFCGKPIPPSILAEGYAMLRTIVSDFKAANHSVTTFLDSRLALLDPPMEADFKIKVSSPRETDIALRRIFTSADAAYIIAPETNGILQNLVHSIEQASLLSLNCHEDAIEKLSEKTVLQETAKKLGLSTPNTIVNKTLDSVEQIEGAISGQLDFPLIFKPLDGVGCCGLSVVRNKDQIATAVNKIRMESVNQHFIAQELVQGVPASVSLLSTCKKAVAISLNKQNVTLEAPEINSYYQGGYTPLSHRLKERAFAAAKKLVSSLDGLRGFVGVDMILTEKNPVIIEVNPRLTTSYVGIRRNTNFNLAQATVDAVVKSELPDRVQSSGSAYFSKVETTKISAEALKKTYKLDSLLSPPFPVSCDKMPTALISTHGSTLEEAESRFQEAKKCLQGIT